MYKKISLKKGKEASLLRKHHWIFSGAIQTLPSGLQEGEVVYVCNAAGQIMATGYYNTGSISIKILSWKEETIDESFFINRITTAYLLRKNAGLVDLPGTNAYRLVHGEGDLLPGIIIDNYNGHLVIQAHHLFTVQYAGSILHALTRVVPNIKTVYLKSTAKLNVNIQPFMHGNEEECIIEENSVKFRINWVKGQKTGFFLDQRLNRKLLGSYAAGKKVLNTFCYTGGFSLYAMAGKASSVDSVDSSAYAIDELNKNVALNEYDQIPQQNLAVDALDYLTQMGNEYNLIILDPPAFAKSLSAKHKAIMAYKRINAIAISKIQKGGILFTYSCSQVIDRFTFSQTVLSASIESGRQVRVLHTLGQPADHPVNIFHPETEYLKGLVLYID